MLNTYNLKQFIEQEYFTNDLINEIDSRYRNLFYQLFEKHKKTEPLKFGDSPFFWEISEMATKQIVDQYRKLFFKEINEMEKSISLISQRNEISGKMRVFLDWTIESLKELFDIEVHVEECCDSHAIRRELYNNNIIDDDGDLIEGDQ